jgi:thermitase
MAPLSKRNSKFPRLTLIALAAGLMASGYTSAGETGYWAKSRILIETRAGLQDRELSKILSRHGGRSARRMGKVQVHVVNLPSEADERVAVELLKRNPHIKAAEIDKLVAPEQVGNDTYYASAWHLPKIQAPTAWDSSLGAGVTIAILDSGVDGAHPDLQGKLVPGWNFYDKNSNTSDVYGHGTKVAGSAAAASNNGTGVTGVAWNAKIMPVRVSDTSGYAFFSTIAEGIYWAADNGAKVVNISYAVQNSISVQNAANYLRTKGGLVINSAGNTSALDATLANGSLISVSATTIDDVKASWSSFGNYVDVSAPGAGIWTTARGGGYAAVSGTSFASPVTAGVVALMMSANPALKPTELENILKTTAVDLGTAGNDQLFGAGRINAAAAVQKAKGLSVIATADVTAPLVAITSPGTTTVNGIVPVNVNATDNLGVVKVELYAKGVLVATDLTPPYSFSWDSTKVVDGSASLTAKAYDAAGNMATSSAISVTVSNAVEPPPAPTAPAATEVILDNAALGAQDAVGGRTFVGTWCQSESSGSYVAGSLYSCGSVADSYRWTPQLAAAGNYDVYVWWTNHANRSSSVPISVIHKAGTATKTFDQKTGGGKWVLLGRYSFDAGKIGYVEVKATNGQACADAVRFVPAP